MPELFSGLYKHRELITLLTRQLPGTHHAIRSYHYWQRLRRRRRWLLCAPCRTQCSDDRCPSTSPPEGSHHGSSRLIRHAYGEGEKYVPLVLRAQQLWDELAEISGEAVFERTGVINLGPASSAFLANVAASARAFQLEVEELDARAVMQRWPEIRLPDDYRAIFEPASGVLRSELAVETGSVWRGKQAARSYSTVRSRLFITMLTGSPSIPSTVNIMVKAAGQRRHLGHPPASGPPYPAGTQGVRWYRADGRYSSKNHFPAFTGELPNGDQYYGFPAEDNELKIGKHNGGQPISTPQERVAFGAVASDGSESFPFCVTSCPASAAACTAPPVPTTIPSMRTLLSIRCRAGQTRC